MRYFKKAAKASYYTSLRSIQQLLWTILLVSCGPTHDTLSPQPTTTSVITPPTLSPQQLGRSEIWYIAQYWHWVLDTPSRYDHAEIVAFNPTTQATRTLIHEDTKDAWIVDVSFSPNGKYIAYTRYFWNGNGSPAFVVAHSDGSDVRVVLENENFQSAEFFWLSNNRLIAMAPEFKAPSADEGDWYLYDPSSRQLQKLIKPNNLALTCLPARYIFPQDKLPVWKREPKDWRVLGIGHLEIKNNAISIITDIPFDPQSAILKDASCQAWTSNIGHIVVTNRGCCNNLRKDFYLVANNGQDVKQITNFGNDYAHFVIDEPWSLSPDGKWLACTMLLDKPHMAGLVEGLNIITLISTDGKVIKHFGDVKHEGRFVWSPDSRYAAISLQSGKVSEIHVIDVQTMEMKQITFNNEEFKAVFDWR